MGIRLSPDTPGCNGRDHDPEKPLYADHDVRIESWSKFLSEAYWNVAVRGKRRPAGVPDRTADYESARRGSIPRRGTEERFSECAGSARDRAKVVDQVQFLARTLTAWRWSQTAWQPPAKRFEAGSTPAGASWKAEIRPGQRRTAPCPRKRLSATCVPHMGSDQGSIYSEVSSVVEHQTENLAVAGSTPVPNRRLVTCSKGGPRVADVRAVGRRHA